MKTLTLTATTLSMLLLTACGAEQPAEPSNTADDFAARINGEADSNSGPSVVQPRSVETQQVFDGPCDASIMDDFIGKPADPETRAAVTGAAEGKVNVRYQGFDVDPYVPNPDNPSLYLMLDNQGNISRAECG